MIKSSSKNGIKVDKDIELVMKNTGSLPWYDYLFQYMILAALCMSVCFSFSSGYGIHVDHKTVILVLGGLTAYFMVLYSFGSIFKYTGIVTLFVYVMFGYINLEQLQAGYAGVYNTFVALYNEYFNASLKMAVITDQGYENAEQYFLLFFMVLVVAVICYTGMYARTMFPYIIITVPIVYASFIVGYTPSMKAYLGYIVGTIALFVGTILEKYGLLSKANRVSIGTVVVHTLEKARIRAQMASFVMLFVLFGIVYFWYSPKRYEEEFDANEIKLEIQQKIKDLASTDLLQGTILNRLTEGLNTGSNSGMSNGSLGRIGTLKYANTTALQVTTERTDINKSLFLKGYVGETYTGDAWKPLSKEDQQRVTELNENLRTNGDVELLYQSMQDQYQQQVYPYLPIQQFSIDVKNVNADSSCSYVPYNFDQQYELVDGKVKNTSGIGGNYMMYDLGSESKKENYYETLFHYGKFSSLLQLNIINTRIIEDAAGESIAELNDETDRGLSNVNIMQTSTLPLKDVDASAPDGNTQTVGMVTGSGGLDGLSMNTIYNYEEYSRDENLYFNLVKDIYTKLPESGLDKVKELVKDKQVVYAGEEVNGYYDTMDQVDTTAYARMLYDKYQDALDFDTDELCSEDLTYNELMNQDKMFQAITFVKDYLAENTSYTLSPGATPEGKDYVEYFLFEKKKGYCMHYASAATVMLRAMGVPARYVEGYILTSDDFRKAQEVGSLNCDYYSKDLTEEREEELVQVDVKDTNAHAWVEVYLPGYGWTPIEMTAPYTDGSSIEVPPVNSNPKATLKPTKKPEATPLVTAAATKAPSATETLKPAESNERTELSVLIRIAQWYDGLSTAMKKAIQVAFFSIVFLLLIIMGIILRRKALCVMFARRMQQMGRAERVLYAYSQMQRITKPDIPAYDTKVSHQEYAAQFAGKYSFVTEENAAVYFGILLKAKFGDGELSREEEHLAMAFYRTFVKNIYRNVKRSKKLYYDYILVILK